MHPFFKGFKKKKSHNISKAQFEYFNFVFGASGSSKISVN